MRLWELLHDKLSTANLLALGLLWLTIAISVIVSYRHSGLPRSWRGFREHVIPPGTFSHPSARTDLLFWISRKFVNLLLITPIFLTTLGIGSLVNRGLVGLTGWQPAAPGPISTPMLLLFTLSMFLTYDLGYYLYHLMQHKVPILWEIHKVHHSAEVMVGTTKDRIHPIDDFMNHIWDGLVGGLVYGLWLFVLHDPVELTFFGLNVYVLRNILMLDFTRHTHYKISFGPINHVLLCPHWHQLHHSVAPEHWDRNFGLMLSVWDRLFGTLAIPKPNEDFVFGLTDREHEEYRSWWRLYYIPLVKIYRRVAQSLAISQQKVRHET